MKHVILYSEHAVGRMMQRKITVGEIEMVINSPDGKIKQSKDKYVYYKKIPGRKDNLIAVVTANTGKTNTTEVITVMINFEVRE